VGGTAEEEELGGVVVVVGITGVEVVGVEVGSAVVVEVAVDVGGRVIPSSSAHSWVVYSWNID
jgi:hypothetical protein